MSANNRHIHIAFTDGDFTALHRQVRALTQLATTHRIKVIGQIILPFCTASEYVAHSHLAVLIGRWGGDDLGMVLVTDLSSLLPYGPPSATTLIKKLMAAGVSVVTPDLGVVDGELPQALVVEKFCTQCHHATG